MNKTRDAMHRHWNGGAWSEGFYAYASELEEQNNDLLAALESLILNIPAHYRDEQASRFWGAPLWTLPKPAKLSPKPRGVGCDSVTRGRRNSQRNHAPNKRHV
jgi:hypothetical protein